MCIEIYTQDQYDNEFNRSSLTFETTNMNIDYQAYTKIVHEYYYIRCILNLSPDGSSIIIIIIIIIKIYIAPNP